MLALLLSASWLLIVKLNRRSGKRLFIRCPNAWILGIKKMWPGQDQQDPIMKVRVERLSISIKEMD